MYPKSTFLRILLHRSPLGVAVLCALLLFACGGGRRAKNGTARTDSHSVQSPSRRLTSPTPPAMLSTDSARLDYVVSHFWDSFDRRDTTWIADTAALEQAFANWTNVLGHLPSDKAAQSINAFMISTEVCPAMRDRLLEVAERYFHDPNSPLRSEDLYIPILQYVIASPAIEDVYKIRPRAQLAMALKNRPGMVAADFAYKTGTGRSGWLSGSRADYTLLLFYNPGCPDCARVEEFIAHSPVIAPLVASGTLNVLAIYPDADLKAWREHLPKMPAGWTVARDPAQTITDNELYDLRAIPCLYLLDTQKRVLLKDAPVEQIETWLAQTKCALLR